MQGRAGGEPDADAGADWPAERRPLPFGLRLDKWRAGPRQPPDGPGQAQFRRAGRAGRGSGPRAVPEPLDLGIVSTPPAPGSGEESESGASSLPAALAPGASPGKRGGDWAGMLADKSPKRTATPPLASPSPNKKSAVLNLMVAAKMKGISNRLRSAADDAPPIKKEKSDTEWVIEQMVKLLDRPDNIFAHGFNETDAKMMGLVCTHLRVPAGETFAAAGDACEHVAMVLKGSLAAYHHNAHMDTYEVGSHIGTMGLTAEHTKYVFTIVAQEDVFMALLPHAKFLNYINDLETEREEQIMNYCFEVLFVANLEAVHKCEVYDSARLVQNSFRAHLARREFWSIRQHLEALPANVIQRVWRGHRARKWLW